MTAAAGLPSAPVGNASGGRAPRGTMGLRHPVIAHCEWQFPPELLCENLKWFSVASPGLLGFVFFKKNSHMNQSEKILQRYLE